MVEKEMKEAHRTMVPHLSVLPNAKMAKDYIMQEEMEKEME